MSGVNHANFEVFSVYIQLCTAGEGEEFLAGLPIAYGTAHMSLVHRANLKPGEKILISGAAGGVGLAAVQVGNHLHGL